MPAGQIQPDACVCKKALLEHCHNYSFNASRMAAFPVRQQTSVIATDTTWTSKHKKVSIQPFAKKEKYACQHLFQGKSHWRIWRQGLAIPDKQRQQSNKEKKKKRLSQETDFQWLEHIASLGHREEHDYRNNHGDYKALHTKVVEKYVCINNDYHFLMFAIYQVILSI